MDSITLTAPGTYQPLTITSGIHASARRTPNKIALIDGPRTLTFAQLTERMARLGQASGSALGMDRGAHAGVVGPNTIEFLEVVLGLGDVGIATATLSPRLNARELGEICDDALVQVLFAHESTRATVTAASFATVKKIVYFGGEYEQLLAAHEPIGPASPPGEWEIFSIPYTSGTTGQAKGVLLSHRSRALCWHQMAIEYGCYGPDDKFLAIAPFAHGAGLSFALMPIYFGGTCEMLNRFDAQTVVEKIASKQFTGVFLVPTQFHTIFTLDPAFLAAHRQHALRAMISNASALPQAMKERIIAQWGEGILHETYGCTEVGVSTNLRPPDQLRKQQCVGQSIPCVQVKLLDEDGNETPRGEIGELYSIASFMFSGYWQNGAPMDPPLRDGWFSAGDLARQDDEGYIYIVDRKKDMIVSGGINIYPRQIEEVLFRHPAVREVAVVGIPDEKWGEKLKAFIVKRDDMSPTIDALVEYCMQNLSSYKVPRDFAFIEALPRNPNGKILKRSLRDM